MKAVILCGGQGLRIRDSSEPVPKPMLQIGGRPIVWHIMKMYAHHGITDFVLCLGHRGWVIKEYFLNYAAMTSDLTVTLGRHHTVDVLNRTEGENWKITLAETGESTMTAGRVAAIRRYVEGAEPFLLTYGDGVADVDIGASITAHRRHGKVATVTAVRPQGRFGEIVIEDGLVREFNEKPQTDEGFINGGFFVFDGRRIWDYIGDDPMTTLEQEPLRRLARDNELVAHAHTGFWQPMDTYREFLLLNEMWSSGKARWKTW
jgi:glucose-1-phosphate cytidylyltransferase